MVKVYPKYKDSGAPWFGEVPSHWQTPRLGSVLRERKETNKANDVTKILSVMKDIGVIPYEEKGKVGNKCSEDITRYKIVRPGDIVANCMNIIIGSVGLSKYTGCLSPVYYVLTPRSQEDDSRFFDYVFKIKPFQLSLVRLGNGILAHRMRIPMELLKCETVPKPPVDEQKAIVEYLDAVNKIIRRYIHEKQKVIKLLNEQKQAIINRAITKGINPNVRFRPSGVDWIGDIPEHWKMKKMKQVVTLIVSNVDKHSFPEETAVRLCNYTDVYKNEIITSNIDFMKATATLNEIVRFKLKTGDVAITKDSEEWTDIAVPALINYEADDFVCGYHLAILRPNEEAIESKYLLKILQSSVIAVQFHIAANGVTRYGLSHQAIKDVLIPVPSIQEQKGIVAYIAERTSGFQKMIVDTNKEIDLIREYRTRIISDAVTGKIDTRDTKLPEIEDITDSEPIKEQEILEDAEDTEEVVNADERYKRKGP